MNTIKTTIHAYRFDIRKPAENAKYRAMCDMLKGQKLQVFCTWGAGKGHYELVQGIDGQTVELETKHLFNNQWNTAPIPGFSDSGLRVFDWAEDYPINFSASIKLGHYLTQTEDMRQARANRMHCGYCGFQCEAQRGYVFCPNCLDSEYLTEKDLKLTRMAYVCDESQRAELSDAEKAHLLPLYRAAQIHGSTERGRARIAKKRADMLKQRDAAIRKANEEFDGFTWILDRGLSSDNVIYYGHTSRFSWGWRKPLQDFEVSAILDVISEFPFAYELVCADGRKLSGN